MFCGSFSTNNYMINLNVHTFYTSKYNISPKKQVLSKTFPFVSLVFKIKHKLDVLHTESLFYALTLFLLFRLVLLSSCRTSVLTWAWSVPLCFSANFFISSLTVGIFNLCVGGHCDNTMERRQHLVELYFGRSGLYLCYFGCTSPETYFIGPDCV